MKINIGFGVNDSYVQHMGVLMTSILCNASKKDDYKFFIVTDYISKDNKQKIEDLKKIKDFEVEYINIDKNEWEKIKGKRHLGLSAYYRYALFKLESVNKILYLDSDMVCRKDIRELYKIDLLNYAIAGVEDIVGKEMIQLFGWNPNTVYINSGMILINLKQTRKIDLFKLSTIELPNGAFSEDFSDQDMINYAFANKIMKVDIKWNYSYPFHTTYSDQDYYFGIKDDPSILHWISNLKPWNPGPGIAHMWQEYFKYYKKSPWYNEEFMTDYIIEGNALIIKSLQKIQEKLGITI